MSKEVMREVLHSMQNFQKLYGDSFFTDEIKQVKKLLATCQRCGEVNPAEIHTCTPKSEEGCAECGKQAAELRRLHEVNADLIDALQFCAGTSYITDAHEVAEETLSRVEGK